MERLGPVDIARVRAWAAEIAAELPAPVAPHPPDGGRTAPCRHVGAASRPEPELARDAGRGCDTQLSRGGLQDGAMEARILPLPNPSAAPCGPSPARPSVRVDGDRIVVERLVLADAALAASLAERDEADRPAVVERALRIGLLALQDAATSMDTDVVRREFEKLVAQTTAGQRAGGTGGGGRPARQLRGRRRPPAAHAGEVPR